MEEVSETVSFFNLNVHFKSDVFQDVSIGEVELISTWLEEALFVLDIDREFN